MDTPVSETFLDEMYGGDLNFMREVVTEFFKEIDQKLPELRDAAQNFNGQKLWSLSHAFIGSAGCIGAEHFQAKARALEACAQAKQAAEAPRLLQEFESEVDAIRQFFDDYLSS